MVDYSRIAISGKARSGKNTAAEIIKNYLEDCGVECKIFAFADPIKEMIMKMFPKTDPQALWGPSELRSTIIPNCKDSEGKPLTVRQVCLDLGKQGRIYNQDTWILSTIDSIDNFIKEKSDRAAILVDLRFFNEFMYLNDRNFFTCRITRPVLRKEVQDISEVDLDDVSNDKFNCFIENNSTLEDFEAEVKRLAEHIAMCIS